MIGCRRRASSNIRSPSELCYVVHLEGGALVQACYPDSQVAKFLALSWKLQEQEESPSSTQIHVALTTALKFYETPFVSLSSAADVAGTSATFSYPTFTSAAETDDSEGFSILFTRLVIGGGFHWLGCLRDCLRGVTVTMMHITSMVKGLLYMLVLRESLSGSISDRSRIHDARRRNTRRIDRRGSCGKDDGVEGDVSGDIC